jgi:hypothetical protein
MPIISFTNQALSSFGLTPSNLTFSVSGDSPIKTVEVRTFGSGPSNVASLSAKQVRGLAFNALTSPASGTGAWSVTLSAATGTTFRVDRAYNGQTFAVIYTDNTSTLFTVVTGTAAQSLTANGFDTVIPETRRKYLLGYI